jgi:hypothetical protein
MAAGKKHVKNAIAKELINTKKIMYLKLKIIPNNITKKIKKI